MIKYRAVFTIKSKFSPYLSKVKKNSFSKQKHF